MTQAEPRVLSSARPLRPRLMGEAGNAAMLFALAIPAVIVAVGLAIDWSRMNSARQHLQHALDNATLAGAREYMLTAAQPKPARAAAAEVAAQQWFTDNLNQPSHGLNNAALSVNVTDMGEVQTSATGKVPLMFGAFFGMADANLRTTGAAMGGDGRKLEIVLALDNTSSMFASNRFTIMRQAAKGFVNTVFDQTPAEGLTAVSVIPWAALVNIKSETPGDWNAAPALALTPPAAGTRTAPPAPFSNRLSNLWAPTAQVAYANAQMSADFAPVGWRGCVRAASGERAVSAAGAVNGALTDAPVSSMRWHAAWVKPELQTIWVSPPPPPPPAQSTRAPTP